MTKTKMHKLFIASRESCDAVAEVLNEIDDNREEINNAATDGLYDAFQALEALRGAMAQMYDELLGKALAKRKKSARSSSRAR